MKCNCIPDDMKLPKVVNIEPVKCVKVSMDNKKEYNIKVGDLVGIQFIADHRGILVRRGRIKELVVINCRELSTPTDNASRIILDCSEQFSVKLIEIKFKDIIAIGGIDDEFEDYNDVIEHLKPSQMEGNKIPIRHGGMCEEKHPCHKPVITNCGIPLKK